MLDRKDGRLSRGRVWGGRLADAALVGMCVAACGSGGKTAATPASAASPTAPATAAAPTPSQTSPAATGLVSSTPVAGSAPAKFWSSVTGLGWPPGVDPSSQGSWGQFQQYTYTADTPQTETSAAADHAIGVLAGVQSADQSTSVEFYVFPDSSDASAFYAEPPVGIIAFPYQGRSTIVVPGLPATDEAYAVTDCGGSSTETSPTSCTGGGGPYVAGSVLYALDGFVVAVVGYVDGSPGNSSSDAAAGARQAAATLRAAVAFANQHLS